jgi:Serine carboxypeptidase
VNPGYVDVDFGAKHLFFYFFESRGNPDTDDVIMWINGGPGCSSSTGLLMELGIYVLILGRVLCFKAVAKVLAISM